MAMASAAKAMGYTPYWMDLNSYGETTCTKVIGAQNDLYSLGSRLSKNPIFNKLVWEPMNYEGFRALSYNAADQKNAELMAPVYRNAVSYTHLDVYKRQGVYFTVFPEKSTMTAKMGQIM